MSIGSTRRFLEAGKGPRFLYDAVMYDPLMRVLTTLEILQARERVSGAELARRMEVSRRTVQRYVARLQDLGIPVESTRGATGYYRLRPGFRLPPLMFTDEEAFALTLGLRALQKIGLTAFAPAAEGALAKLSRVLPEPIRARAIDVEEGVTLDVGPWTVPVAGESLVLMAAAVRSRHPVAMKYVDHGDSATSRVLEPYGLVHADGRWYAVGFCRMRQALRTFRLDRVREVEGLDERFERPAGFDPRTYLRETLSRVAVRYEVRVRLDMPLSEAEGRLDPWRVNLTAHGSGTLLACKRDCLGPLAARLLELGCDIEVHEPAELIDIFAGMAERARRAAAPRESMLGRLE